MAFVATGTTKQIDFNFQVKSIELGYQPFYNKEYFTKEFPRTSVMFHKPDSGKQHIENFKPEDINYGVGAKKLHEERF